MRWSAEHNSAFGIVIDFGMEMPSGFIGTTPEFYFVITVVIEESEEVCNGNNFTLTRVVWGVESIFEERESLKTMTPREVALVIPD